MGWVASIAGAAKGLVGVITGATSLSAVLSGIMAKATITANMLTLGIATGIFALSLYLVNVVDRTLNRKINQSLDKLEQQTKKASDTTKNAFIQPTQDTAKMKDNMSSVADSTKEIKDNLQSFDVIHAIEQQAEMVANVPEVPETIIDIEMQDYSKFLDNLVKEATNIDTSITSAVIPKLEDMSIKLGDILETVSVDVSRVLGGLKTIFDTALKGLGDAFKFLTDGFTNLWNDIKLMLGIGQDIGPTRLMTEKEASAEWTQQLTKSSILPLVQVEPKFTPAPSYYQPGVTEPKIVLEIKERKYEYPDFLTREYYINGKRVKPRP